MSAEPTLLAPVADEPASSGRGVLRRLLTNISVLIGGSVLVLMTLIGLLAPQLGTIDPTAINPVARNEKPGFERTIRAEDGASSTFTHRLGTDSLGRDVYSRVVYSMSGLSIPRLRSASSSAFWPAMYAFSTGRSCA